MDGKLIRIMIVAVDGELVRRVDKLWDVGKVTTERVPSLVHALSRFERDTFDVLLVTSIAFKSGEIDGAELLEVISAKCSITQVLFLAEPQDFDLAMAAIQAGSFQYAKLPVSDPELKMLIESAMEHQPEYGTNLLLVKDDGGSFPNIIGQSEAMQQVFKQIDQAATTDIPVLLQGETGTGKDLIALAIHNRSNRSGSPFMPVHIGALPPDLIGSELFGHEKGAFTGALRRHQGKFEQGDGGTVFLDEIGSIDEKMQVSLLRLIEQKLFHRLGGSQLIHVDVRLIAATNEDLPALVKQGRFRDDLFFRLDVFRIMMPPLRDRHSDVPLLTDAFLNKYNREFQKQIAGVDATCMQRLESYAWPGNVRELKHVIQRAVLICEGALLTAEHLPPRFQKGKRVENTVTFEIGTPLDEIEHKMIVRTLLATGDNRKRAAELLGISRRSLYNKLKKYDIS